MGSMRCGFGCVENKWEEWNDRLRAESLTSRTRARNFLQTRRPPLTSVPVWQRHYSCSRLARGIATAGPIGRGEEKRMAGRSPGSLPGRQTPMRLWESRCLRCMSTAGVRGGAIAGVAAFRLGSRSCPGRESRGQELDTYCYRQR